MNRHVTAATTGQEASGANDGEVRLKVFISYSRRDISFVDRLVAALEARGFDVLIDRRDLPALEDWERELVGFIRQSDTVVFVVSQHSIASKVCGWEIEQVRSYSKRLAPVVIADMQGAEVPQEIARINYLFFTDESLFEQRADELARALNTDVAWLKEHTRLGELARRWFEHDRPEDQLIRGRDLEDADGWAARRPREAPVVTDLQLEFLATSRAAQAERLRKEQFEVARTRRFQTRAAWGLAGVAVLVLVMLTGTLWQARENEKRQAKVLTSLAQKAIDGAFYERAMRIALLGLPVPGRAPWLPGWSTVEMTGLEAKLAGAAQLLPLQLEITGYSGPISSRVLLSGLRASPGAAISPDGGRIVTASHDNTARVWDAKSGGRLLELTGHADSVRTAAFSPDGTRIVTASNDNTARVWDAKSGATLFIFTGHSGPVNSASFSPDGKRIATASDDNTVRMWDAKPGVLLELVGHASWVRTIDVSADGARLVTGSEDATARVWDAKSGAQILELSNGGGPISGAAFSSDGARIVTGSRDGVARVWDAKSGARLIDFTGHGGWIRSAAFRSDGAAIVTASFDKTARVWDAKSAVQLLMLTAHNAKVSSAVFSPDSARIVTGADDSTARVWDAKSGTQLVELNGHGGWVRSGVFSFDGARILTGSQDKTARIWDAKSGAQLLTLAGHGGAVMNAAFSPDGERVVTSSEDTTARVWDARTGVQLLELRGHTGPIDKAMFSPDGLRIATASEDKTARVWEASWLVYKPGEELADRVCAEKLLGNRQLFTADDEFDPILQGLAGTNPCERAGPLSLKYWSEAMRALWRRLAGPAAAS